MAILKFRTKAEREKILNLKKAVIRSALIRYFNNLDITRGEYANIPAFYRADMEMKKVLKTSKDVSYFYNLLQQIGMVGV